MIISQDMLRMNDMIPVSSRSGAIPFSFPEELFPLRFSFWNGKKEKKTVPVIVSDLSTVTVVASQGRGILLIDT